MAQSPEEKLLIKQTETLEEAYRANLVAGLLLRQQLQAGLVACEDLRRHNVACSKVHNAQLKIVEYFRKHGQATPLPSMPLLFFPAGRIEVYFSCANPKKLVGPNDFDVYLPSKITAEAFNEKLAVGLSSLRDEGLGAVPLIPLVIAGITVVVAATIIAKVALETSRDTEIALVQLEAIRHQAQLSQYVAEARNELMRGCMAKGGGAQECAELAQKTIDSVPPDLSKIGVPKFESNWTSWLLGGILVGGVAVVGSALYVRKRGAHA